MLAGATETPALDIKEKQNHPQTLKILKERSISFQNFCNI